MRLAVAQRANAVRSISRPSKGYRVSRSPLRVVNKLVLQPTGDGSTEHLGDKIKLPAAIELAAGVFEVGRQEPADIIIAIPTVSSRHALLRVEEKKVSVTDLNSTNGTMVNGKDLTPMQATELPVGSEVTFGDMYLAKFQLVEVADAASEVVSGSASNAA